MWYLQVPVGAYKYLRQSLVIIDFTVLRKNIFIEGAPKNGWGDEQKQFIKSKTPYMYSIMRSMVHHGIGTEYYTRIILASYTRDSEVVSIPL